MSIPGLFLGIRQDTAYVYIWVIKSCRVVYIGQTNCRYGVLGRAGQHVLPQGTLRQRLEEWGYDLDDVDDPILLSFPLPREPQFVGIDSAYREAVEYHVQVKLQKERVKCAPPFCIISRVTCTYPTEYASLEMIADEIVSQFIEAYPLL